MHEVHLSNFLCNDQQVRQISSTINNELTETKTKCTDRNRNLPNYEKCLSHKNKLIFDFKGKGLRVAYVTLQYLLPKLDGITCKLTENTSVDIFVMVETFLHSDITDNTLLYQTF